MNFTSSTFVNPIDKHFFHGADLFTVPWQTNRLWLMHSKYELHTNRAVFTTGKDVCLLIDDKVK